MTDTTLTIVLTAIPATLVALATLIVGIINSIKANKIHFLVNSNMTKVQFDLATAKKEIDGLKELIVALVEEKDRKVNATVKRII